jgi:P4 family phage/plasmid primase-like protien
MEAVAVKPKYSNLEQFLTAHVIPKESKDLEITHTEFSQFSSRKFHIPDEDHAEYLQLYFKDVIKPKKTHNLIERQFIEKNKQAGPILIDIDFRFPAELTTRQYQKIHIDQLIEWYLTEIETLFEMDEDVHFPVIVQEKPSPRVEIKETGNVVKDGIHLIIGIAIDRKYHQWLRTRIIGYAEKIWTDLKIINVGGWEDVLDPAISNGVNGWLMPFSKKRDDVSHYVATQAYNVNYDVDANEWIMHSLLDDSSKLDSFMSQHYRLMSPRMTNRPKMSLLKDDMVEKLKQFDSKPTAKPVTTTHVAEDSESFQIPLSAIRVIRNKEDMMLCLNTFLDNLSSSQYELREMFYYTMTLPETYYGPGSYSKWIKVGFALRSISVHLHIVWIAFSAQSSSFQYSDISNLCDMWAKFQHLPIGGVTKQSLMYWSKNDAGEKYAEVREKTLDYYLEQTIENITLDQINNPRKKNAKGSSDYDLATVLYQMKKGEYVACSIKSNEWFKFKNHRWSKNDSGTSLRNAISTDLRSLYHQKARTLSARAMTFKTPDGELNTEHEEYKLIMGRANKVLDIALSLGASKDKDNIMKEARELFYDPEFMEKLDQNKYLLCFSNGVIDFKEKVFRKGYPEDFISKSTNADYIPLNPEKTRADMEEIRNYMNQLFPIPELCAYMWDHLASILIGDTALNQCLHYYTGIGQNGKSMLVKFVQTIMGDYAVELDVSFFTQERPRRGQSTPELFAIIGARFAVTAEPSEGEKLNEGPMKQLTSGTDKMSCRALYGQQVTFTPQVSSVIMANHFLDIKSRDHGTWRRIRVVEFMSLFTDDPVQGNKDKKYQFKKVDSFDEKFRQWAPTFMAMLVARAFETNGIVKVCDMVSASSNKYRKNQDFIAEFMDDQLEAVKGDMTKLLKKTELNVAFADWYKTTYGNKIFGKTQELHTAMDKQFGECKSGKGWAGVKIKIHYDEAPDYSNNSLQGTDGEDDDDFDQGPPILF